MVKEKWSRTFARTLTWRVSGVLILAVMAALASGTWKGAFAVAIGYNFLRWGLHFIHERLWLKSSWGWDNDAEQLKSRPI